LPDAIESKKAARGFVVNDFDSDAGIGLTASVHTFVHTRPT
jgi:hypothetical protein